MNKGILSLVSFAAGGAAGYLAANRMLKERYEQKTQEDIASVKEAFHKELNRYRENHQGSDEGFSKAEAIKDYRDKVLELEYAPPTEGTVKTNGPKVISPEDFGSQENYDEINLTYYIDGTLTDDADRVMDDAEIEDTVGRESLRHFGDYEDDSVHVRNDRLKADYEILKDPRSYGEVLREKPYLR